MEPENFYRINKFPPHIPILSHLDPVHTLTSHFRKIYLNIILPSSSLSPKWLLFLQGSLPKTSIRLSSLPNALHAHPILWDNFKFTLVLPSINLIIAAVIAGLLAEL
jgi:hypothetical protein